MKLANIFAAAFFAGAAGLAWAEGPVNYPDSDAEQVSAVSSKTRAQVKAELAEARRLGLVVYGEADVLVATPEQERLIAEAGRRAIQSTVASH